MPILFLSGLQDEIVPPGHMKTLYEACQAKVKVWRDFPDGSHNDTCAERGYFEYIEGFIREVVLRGRTDFREGSKEGSPPDELEKL